MSVAPSSLASDSRDYRLAWVLLTYFLAASIVGAILRQAGLPGSRYLIYSIPAFAFISVLALVDTRRLVLDTRVFAFLCLYGLSVIATTIYTGYFKGLATRDIVLTTAPFLALLVSFRIPRNALLWMVGGLLLLHFLNIIDEIASGTLGSTVSLQYSQGIAESIYAFPLTAMCIYLICTKRYRLALLTFIAVFLAFKRIAVGGMFCALGAYLLLRLIDGNLTGVARPGWRAKVALAGFLVVMAVISRHIPEIFDYLDLQYGPLYKHTPEEVLLGRYKVNTNVFHFLFHRPDLYDYLFGMGLGSTSAYAMKWTGVVLLHNDMLKLQLEHGLIGAVMIVTGWFLVFSRTYLSMALFVFAVTLWLTDNTLIYVDFSFVLVFLNRFACQELLPEEQDEERYTELPQSVHDPTSVPR